MSGRSLPPGGHWVTLPNGERRVEVVVDLSRSARGKRRQSRRRFRTVAEARDFYAETHSEVRRGTHVARERETVGAAVESWLDGRRKLKATTLAGYRNALLPVVASYGAAPVQQLTKGDLDELVTALMRGGHESQRRPWKPRTVNLMLFVLGAVLDDLVKQGRLARNVAALVDRPSMQPQEMSTWTAGQAEQFLEAAAGDAMQAAWMLALYGMRRGEIAGLRWDDVKLDEQTLLIRQTRVSVSGEAQESTPKSDRSTRILPLTPDLDRVLRETRKRQSEQRLALGLAYADRGYVVADEIGQPLHPDTITSRWSRAVAACGLPRIRLHDARHTCGTLMHLRGVPTAVISAWLGHSSPAFTMRTYVHSQDEALRDAAATLGSALRSNVTTA